MSTKFSIRQFYHSVILRFLGSYLHKLQQYTVINKFFLNPITSQIQKTIQNLAIQIRKVSRRQTLSVKLLDLNLQNTLMLFVVENPF